MTCANPAMRLGKDFDQMPAVAPQDAYFNMRKFNNESRMHEMHRHDFRDTTRIS